MYTILSASVLALDLSRHADGAAVTDVVDRVLAGEGLPFDAVGRPRDVVAARHRLTELARTAPHVGAALRSLSRAAADGLPVDATSRAAQELGSALVGRLDDLLLLAQDRLAGDLALAPDVVEVVLDRLVAAWSASHPAAEPDDLTRLSERWDQLVPQVPPPGPFAPTAPVLRDLLEAVARSGQPEWLALERSHAARHKGLSWSSLMHAATRSAHAADRSLDVARWQLSSVRAAHCAGHPRALCAPGAMMSVVGAVQALCVLDVAADDVTGGLLHACREVLGRF